MYKRTHCTDCNKLFIYKTNNNALELCEECTPKSYKIDNEASNILEELVKNYYDNNVEYVA